MSVSATHRSRIGVWNTAFLGDAVLTLPLVQTLRAAFPDAGIDLWVRKGFGGLFAAHPALTAVHDYDKRGKDRGLGQTLRLGRSLGRSPTLASGRPAYSLWICAHTSWRSGMIARLSGAPMRIGYAETPCAPLWHTHRIPRRFAECAEIERLLHLLDPLDLPLRGIEPSTWPQLVLPENARERVAGFFAALAAERQGPVLGIHPGSVWPTKRWPLEYFAAIAARAAREGARVLIFGGPGEEEALAAQTEALAAAALTGVEKNALCNLAGKCSLPELAGFLGLVSCYLTNDSGPMHLAWPQQTPLTALFGPTVRELGFFPRGEGAFVMELPLPCRPCGLHGHRTCPLGHHRCMRDMTPEMVWPDVAAKLFAAHP